MNFELRKPNSDSNHTRLANTCTEHPHGGQQSGETCFGFGTNDFVVYPAHGVGQILAIEEQAVAGASLEFFVIYFEKSKLTLRAPTRKAVNVGLRKLSDPAAIERVRATLNQRPNKARGNWSRVVQEYSSKINSGDIIALAEVVRDLYRPAQGFGQSFSERQLYCLALARLSGEVGRVGGTTEQESARELEELISAAAKRSA